MSALRLFYGVLSFFGGVGCAAACVALACLVSGCAVGPDYQAPRTAAPPAFSAVDGQAVPGVGEAVVTAAPLADETEAGWWRLFGDPLLDSLMERVQTGNPDLKAAQARLRQAKALRRQAVAGYYPEGGPQAALRRQKIADPYAGLDSAVAPAVDRENSVWQASFEASWEIDVFGGVRRGVEAAGAELEAADAALAGTLVSIRAEVGRAYIDARSQQRRLRIARQSVQNRRESVEINDARFGAGLVGELDAARARGDLESALAVIPALDADYRAAVHRLSVLLGLEPGALMAELDRDLETADIPRGPEVLNAGLPSDLLRRRPDVRRAERFVHAATARIGVAEAELFPRFSLTGQFGYQAQLPHELTYDRNNFWSVGPTLSWNILNVKRLWAGVDAAEAARDETLAGYQAAVLTAFEEAENAIVRLSRAKTRSLALERAVQANQRALEIARDRYVGGLESYLAVIDAQTALYSVQDQLAQSEQVRALGLASLYVALGGGWREPGEPVAVGPETASR